MSNLLSIPPELQKIAVLCNLHLRAIGDWRFIGGMVRDLLLQRKITDIDIAIAAPPQLVEIKLQAQQIKVIPTGLKHGTLTAIIDGQKLEITSLRSDEKCDGRRAQVNFISDWRVDAARRDFTINALSLTADGQLHDYFDGLAHLMQKKVAFVGSPAGRIQEDYLRILRYWRFLALLGDDNLDEDSYQAVIQLAANMQQISGERIQAEMAKLMHNPYAADILGRMANTQIWQTLQLPCNFNVAKLKMADDFIVNIALLMVNCTQAEIEALSNRWRLSKIHTKQLKDLLMPAVAIDWGAPLRTHNRYMQQLGAPSYLQQLKLAYGLGRISDMNQYLQLLQSFIPVKFPLNGADLLALGFVGTQIGHALELLKTYWLQHDMQPDKKQLLSYLEGQ